MENKELIVKLLETTLNATRMGRVKLTYIQVDNGEEYVQIDIIDKNYKGYTDRVCVTADSGCALIRDVMRHDWFN